MIEMSDTTSLISLERISNTKSVIAQLFTQETTQLMLLNYQKLLHLREIKLLKLKRLKPLPVFHSQALLPIASYSLNAQTFQVNQAEDSMNSQECLLRTKLKRTKSRPSSPRKVNQISKPSRRKPSPTRTYSLDTSLLFQPSHTSLTSSHQLNQDSTLLPHHRA